MAGRPGDSRIIVKSHQKWWDFLWVRCSFWYSIGMTLTDVPNLRLENQKISQTSFTKPEEVVSWMGAMQAQDYLGSLWAIGLRTKNYTEKDVEKAIVERKIVRTWPMRRTLHWVAAQDVHWMVRLSSERVIKTYAAHMPMLGLSEEIISKARKIVTKALSGGKCMTRDSIYRLFTEAKIPADQSRGIHILWRLGQEAIVCFGPRQGKQQTFTLLDEWVPQKRKISREEAIGEVTLRYFTSHGPATIQDLAWWSGLTVADVKAGVASVKSKLEEEIIDGKQYFMARSQSKITQSQATLLLPAFDEYFISYKDRSAVINPEHISEVNHGLNGMFAPIIVINGRIVGTWKRDIGKKGITVMPQPFNKFTNADRQQIAAAARRYGTFLGFSVRVK